MIPIFPAVQSQTFSSVIALLSSPFCALSSNSSGRLLQHGCLTKIKTIVPQKEKAERAVRVREIKGNCANPEKAKGLKRLNWRSSGFIISPYLVQPCVLLSENRFSRSLVLGAGAVPTNKSLVQINDGKSFQCKSRSESSRDLLLFV